MCEGQNALALAEQQGIPAITEAMLSFCGYDDEDDEDFVPIAEDSTEDSWDACDDFQEGQDQYKSRGQGHHTDKVKYEWSLSAPPVLNSDKSKDNRERRQANKESHVAVESDDVTGKVKGRRKKAAAVSLPNLPPSGHRLTSYQPSSLPKLSDLSLSLPRLHNDFDDCDETSVTSRRGQGNLPLLPTTRCVTAHRQATARISLRGCLPTSRDNRYRDVRRSDDVTGLTDSFKLPRI